MQEKRITVEPTIYNGSQMINTEIIFPNGKFGILRDSVNFKAFKSKNYNFFFNKLSGEFIQWGTNDGNQSIPDKISDTELKLYQIWQYIWGKENINNIEIFLKDIQTDGDLENELPEIADIEISTACRQGCAFCYKSNTANGENMSLETFKKVFSKLTPSITQVAFGITEIDANPDMWDIFDYTRSNGVIPNVTINGNHMTPELFDKLAERCGAVACSVYDKDISYNAIKELTDRGMRQVNIHKMICLENFDETIQILKDCKTDPRLEKLNAIVLLSLKPKGRAKDRFHQLPQDKFNELVNFALDSGVSLGFDSCGAFKFLKAIEGIEKYKYMNSYVESCESTIYSSYINTNGYFFPCSFAEDTNENGLSVVDCNDFLKDIWYNEKTKKFREKAIHCRNCSISCSLFEI